MLSRIIFIDYPDTSISIIQSYFGKWQTYFSKMAVVALKHGSHKLKDGNRMFEKMRGVYLDPKS